MFKLVSAATVALAMGLGTQSVPTSTAAAEYRGSARRAAVAPVIVRSVAGNAPARNFAQGGAAAARGVYGRGGTRYGSGYGRGRGYGYAIGAGVAGLALGAELAASSGYGGYYGAPYGYGYYGAPYGYDGYSDPAYVSVSPNTGDDDAYSAPYAASSTPPATYTSPYGQTAPYPLTGYASGAYAAPAYLDRGYAAQTYSSQAYAAQPDLAPVSPCAEGPCGYYYMAPAAAYPAYSPPPQANVGRSPCGC